MAPKGFPVEHYDGSSSHGPVTLFISDEGEIVLVCDEDGQAWRLPTAAEPIEAPDDATRAKGGGDFSGRRRAQFASLDVARVAFRRE